MANALRTDLRGKTVILNGKYYEGDEANRTFKCEDGFGCSPSTSGSAIFGRFLDGSQARVEGYEVLRMVEG